MLSAFKKIGAGIATYFATDKIIQFGKELVNAAAEVSAKTSAFNQIMGDYADEASVKVGKIADATGMVDSRLTPYMTSMTAKFKGLGFDIDDATNLASDGLTLAADAAAFWDKSLEDSMGGLNSFINGSYEGGEAIGLFANDTQLAMFAVQNGVVNSTKEWANLDEATKQATRLEYAQNMFELSGATGQAAKESDQYANVQANLTEKWRQFKAQIGEPLLQNIVLPAMQTLSGLVDKATSAYERFEPKLQAAKDKLNELGQYASTTFKPAFDKLREAFDKVKNAIQPLTDKIKDWFNNASDPDATMETLKKGVDAIADGIDKLAGFISTSVDKLKEFKNWCSENKTAIELLGVAVGTLTALIVAYNIVQAIKNAGGIVEIAQLAATAVGVGALTVAETAHSVASTVAAAATTAFGAAVNFLNTPIALVILAIGALIAIIVLVVKNWDTIKEKAQEVWDKIVEIWGTVSEWFTTNVIDPIKNKFQELKDSVSAKIDEFKQKFDEVKTKITEIVDGVKNKFQEMKDSVNEKFDAVKTKVSDTFNNVKDTVTNTLETAKNNAKQKLDNMKTAFEENGGGLKGAASAALTGVKDIFQSNFNLINSLTNGKLGEVLNLFKSKFDSVRNTVSNVFNNIKNTVSNVINSVRNTVQKGLDAVKGFFDRLKLKFPDIKLPHFKISGEFSLKPLSVPKFSVDWYAKAMDDGMILNQPTIFGMNANGQLMGAGEAGSETVVGTGSLLEMINGAVRSETNALNSQFEKLISMLATFFPEIIKISKKGIYLNGEMLVGELLPDIDSKLGDRTRLKARGQ